MMFSPHAMYAVAMNVTKCLMFGRTGDLATSIGTMIFQAIDGKKPKVSRCDGFFMV